ncbi:MAG: hypothetical protein P8014_03500 [Acidihalobacter sp.]|uniref:hypothetical protein n=1 Tax=Acidihalobacter sp. TaxID=1872108 RepID=UPI00307CDB20
MRKETGERNAPKALGTCAIRDGSGLMCVQDKALCEGNDPSPWQAPQRGPGRTPAHPKSGSRLSHPGVAPLVKAIKPSPARCALWRNSLESLRPPMAQVQNAVLVPDGQPRERTPERDQAALRFPAKSCLAGFLPAIPAQAHVREASDQGKPYVKTKRIRQQSPLNKLFQSFKHSGGALF